MPIELIPVQSSNVSAIGYDPVTKTLRVTFLSGGIYDYEGVAEEIFQAFLHAESKGRYFRTNIKGHYPTYKLQG